MPQDPIISFLITLLTLPQSELYIPKLIQKCANPKLEPYLYGDVDLGGYAVGKKDYGFFIKDLGVAGISNVQIEKENNEKGVKVPRIYIDDSLVTFYAERPNIEAPMPSIPVKLKINGTLVITPLGSTSLPVIPLQAEIEHAQLLGIFDAKATTGKPESIRIVFKKLALQQIFDKEGNMVITIDTGSILNRMINKILNQPTILQKIVSTINEQLASSAVLDALSAYTTQAAIAALSKK